MLHFEILAAKRGHPLDLSYQIDRKSVFLKKENQVGRQSVFVPGDVVVNDGNSSHRVGNL